jgi:hypothetical protein
MITKASRRQKCVTNLNTKKKKKKSIFFSYQAIIG